MPLRCCRAAAALLQPPPRCCLCQHHAATAKLPLLPATALPTVLLPLLTPRCRQAAATATTNALPSPHRCSATTLSIAVLPPSISFILLAVVAVSAAVATADLD